MKGYSRIIDKIENVPMVSGVVVPIDSKGLNCVIKPFGGSIEIGLSEGKTEYPLNSGEEFEFCGKVFISSSSSPEVMAIYYHTL